MFFLNVHNASLFLVTSLAFSGISLAGSVTEGGSCSPSNDRVDPSIHKFISDCDDRTFFAPKPSGVCVKRLCRKDEFPFGFAPDEPLPPTCNHGFFCPDNGSGCRPTLPSGAPCDMDRDYQCSASKNWNGVFSHWNVNGSVCLKSTCMYANVTVGLPCILERTEYVGYNRDNASYNVTVMRDNCVSSWPKLYCSTTTSICEKMKELGEPCTVDRECLSQYCNYEEHVCSDPPGLLTSVEAWQYVLTALSVLGAVAMTCVFLVLSHKRQRMERYSELLEYYHEQTR
ncbi:uncharacterized protein FOMMEDRAFT_131804 [Fomitiporia mediterranea MF3/22]|uniref:uncharacterized protein n=1 Tax=Fomitiporia mediterranea (strain MF3/22) TaxID=694068 RepID=UPI0004407BB3|nr:uncharacterized protein FOMMEDRAFT_131804 [Fomitiporia mediterranea MF3/22]EJD07076.1 hypothetical protein FOMMEDRAFT_131804 [Fomitiporia mediterranea MF3/22]